MNTNYLSFSADPNLGQLGNGNLNDQNLPVEASGLTGVIAISAGLYFSVALTNTGIVWCWGSNQFGQLANGSTVDSNIPVQISGSINVNAINAGYYHTIATTNSGEVISWGSNSNGQIGVNSVVSQFTTPQLTGVPNAIQITAGGGHSFVIDNANSGWTFGANMAGQLGEGTNLDHLIPVSFSTVCNVLDLEIKTLDSSFSIFPNPAKHNLKISVDLPTSISIINSTGIELLKTEAVNECDVDVSQFAAGIYFVKSASGETIKFIKE